MGEVCLDDVTCHLRLLCLDGGCESTMTAEGLRTSWAGWCGAPLADLWVALGGLLQLWPHAMRVEGRAGLGSRTGNPCLMV